MSNSVDATFDAVEQFLRGDCMDSANAPSQDDELAMATMDPLAFAKEMDALLATFGSDVPTIDLFSSDFGSDMDALMSSDDASVAPELQRSASSSSASSSDFDKDIEAALSFFEAPVTTPDAPFLQSSSSTASSDTEPEPITPPVQTVALSEVLINPVGPTNVVHKPSTVEIVPIAASPVKAAVKVAKPTIAPAQTPVFFPQQPLPPTYAPSPFAMPMPAPAAYMQMMQEQAIMQAHMQMQAQAYAQMAAFYQHQQAPQRQQKSTGRISRSRAPSKRDAPYTRREPPKRVENDDEELVTGWVAPGWVAPSVQNLPTTSTAPLR